MLIDVKCSELYTQGWCPWVFSIREIVLLAWHRRLKSGLEQQKNWPIFKKQAAFELARIIYRRQTSVGNKERNARLRLIITEILSMSKPT